MDEIALLKAIRAIVKEEIAPVNTDIASLKSDVTSLKDDVASLKDDVVSMKADIADLKHGQVRLEAKIDEGLEFARANVNYLAKDVEILEGRLTEHVQAPMH